MGAIEEVKSETTGRGMGERKNANKLRYELTPPYAQQEYVRVLTEGAKKYAPWNWLNGMTWSSVMASMKRHIAAFESGEDVDPETGCLHTAQIMCNAAFITQFYKSFPEGDDRQHRYLSHKRIGLDVDEVLANFVGAYMKEFNIAATPEFWSFDPQLLQRLQNLPAAFWLSLKPLIEPSELTFEPVCYITSRIVDNSVTEKWLHDNHFPASPVYTVGAPEEKLEIAKRLKLDIYVDDRFETFAQFNKAGVCCYLMDAAHNRRYNVGHKRITSLSQLTRF